MQRIEFQSAYILHQRDYRDTSRLVELFSRDYGRLAVVARGVRRGDQKNKGSLQPFVPLLISCQGRGELLTLKSFECAGTVHILKGNALISALYVNELLMRLLPKGDAHPDLFGSYRNLLISLEKEQAIEPLLRCFEKNLLKSTGYQLPLSKEIDSGLPIEASAFYFYDPEKGPVLIKNRSVNEQMDKNLFKGKSLLALEAEKFEDAEALQDAKRLMRQALSLRIGPKPLASRRLIFSNSDVAKG